MLEQLKQRLVDIEKALVETANNHTALQVRADECKYLVSVFESMDKEVAPNSAVAEAIEKAQEVIDAISEPQA